MDNGITIVGALLLLAGAIVYLIEMNLCQRIVVATKDEKDGLTRTDTWLNTRMGDKVRKLTRIANSHLDQKVRTDASRALRLYGLFWILWIGGIIVIGFGETLFPGQKATFRSAAVDKPQCSTACR